MLCKILNFFTVNPSVKIFDFCRLPLHRGGFCGSFDKENIPVR